MKKINSGVMIICTLISIGFISGCSKKDENKKNDISLINESSSKGKSKEKDTSKKSKNTTESTQSPTDLSKEDIMDNVGGENDAPNETTAQNRGAIKSSHEDVTPEEYNDASSGGEYSDMNASEVKLDGGNVVVSSEDLATTRQAMLDAGIDSGAYSDYDIASIYKLASDENLDIATAANDYIS